ncbi:hypothetical protein EJ05DRAFT_475061 [Pseudovirgaria hyperparasitica]|uniref:Uncharacterized protein n=1 Tax=Pseudovirgaria hyperparasitica TaxID=470096 RepID=A0A6A6WEN7_9PEZI|nr:uncharacterized protein EJ05DRAFT_475061 [Pseudovirgaria hyperparasitica]KAF2760047.1 hypothetical protein EJ05DRAFT_475061 [Pseudovirgaria hyperparasitica]
MQDGIMIDERYQRFCATTYLPAYLPTYLPTHPKLHKAMAVVASCAKPFQERSVIVIGACAVLR